MILRTCLTDPGDWEQVVMNIKANLDNLPLSTQQLYQERCMAKLKARCRDKYSLLIKQKNDMQDPELRNLLEILKNREMKYARKSEPETASKRADVKSTSIDEPGASGLQKRQSLAKVMKDIELSPMVSDLSSEDEEKMEYQQDDYEEEEVLEEEEEDKEELESEEEVVQEEEEEEVSNAEIDLDDGLNNDQSQKKKQNVVKPKKEKAGMSGQKKKAQSVQRPEMKTKAKKKKNLKKDNEKKMNELLSFLLPRAKHIFADIDESSTETE